MDTCIRDIVDKTLQPNVPQTRSQSTNVRYKQFARVPVKNERLLSLIEKLSAKQRGVRGLKIAHVGNVLNTYDLEEMFLMIDSADFL